MVEQREVLLGTTEECVWKASDEDHYDLTIAATAYQLKKEWRFELGSDLMYWSTSGSTELSSFEDIYEVHVVRIWLWRIFARSKRLAGDRSIMAIHLDRIESDRTKSYCRTVIFDEVSQTNESHVLVVVLGEILVWFLDRRVADCGLRIIFVVCSTFAGCIVEMIISHNTVKPLL